MTLEEFRQRLETAEQRRSAIAAELFELSEVRSLDTGQQERLDRQTIAHGRVLTEIAELQSEYRSALAQGVESGRFHVESGDGARRSEDDGPTLLRRGGDPWAERSMRDSPDEVRSRALRIVEHGDGSIERGVMLDSHPVTDEQRSRLETLVRTSDVAFADYVVAVSRPQYASAFNAACRSERDLWTDEERAAVREVKRLSYLDGETRASLAEGNTGALMVPFYLDPTIVLTNAGAVNPFRQLARVEQITTSAWHGVTSAGVTAEWTAESQQVADATPTLVQPVVTPVRGEHTCR